MNGPSAKAVLPKDGKVSYWDLRKKGQLAVLCLARFVDPLAQTSIQSYMFYQLRWFDPAASDATISTQAGLLVGAKTAASVCTGMLWGRFADSELGGRKATLVIGLLSSCLSCIGYGLSRTFWLAILFQIFAGAMSNNVAIVRCVVAELNPENRYRQRALVLLPLCANSGMLIGPLVGGLMSLNVDRSWPFAPPNLFIAVLYFITALLVLLLLEETLESLQHNDQHFIHRVSTYLGHLLRGKTKDTYSYAPIDPNAGPEATDSPEVELNPSTAAPLIPPPLSRKKSKSLPFSRIWTRNVLCTMMAHFTIAGHLSTFSALWAIFLSTPIATSSHPTFPIHFGGGLGMPPRDVGFAMSLLGAIGVILQMLIYPPLNDRFGSVAIWRAALFIFPLVYLLAPYPALIASASEAHKHQTHTPFYSWLAVLFVLALFTLGRTGVTPATTLIINDCTPHPSVRGTIHATGTVIGNLGRSVFPVGALAIFGWGLKIGVVGLGFWCVAALAVLACVASKWVQEGTNGKDVLLEESADEETGDAAGDGAASGPRL